MRRKTNKENHAEAQESKVKTNKFNLPSSPNAKSNHQIITDWLQVIINFIMVIITICGLYFIWSEFTQLKKQNELLQTQNESLKESIIQTYRPIAMAKTSWDKPQFRTIDFNIVDDKRINLKIELEIRNVGNGLLTYLGAVNGIAYKKTDFRNMFLNKNSSIEVKGDTKNQVIQTNILRNNTQDLQKLILVNENLPIKEIYYFHVLLFYLDQDGNLYDTEHVERISIFNKTNSLGEMKLKKDHNKTIIIRENYNRYIEKERIKLKSALDHYNFDYIEIP